MLQDILVTGLVNGGVYALLAIGFSLIFGVARIVNIAHTAFYMLAAYCFYTLLTRGGLGFALAGVIAVVSIVVLSLLCYRLVIEPVREHESAVLIATIALGLIFQELMELSFETGGFGRVLQHSKVIPGQHNPFGVICNNRFGLRVFAL